jgi:hypothetical protein
MIILMKYCILLHDTFKIWTFAMHCQKGESADKSIFMPLCDSHQKWTFPRYLPWLCSLLFGIKWRNTKLFYTEFWHNLWLNLRTWLS